MNELDGINLMERRSFLTGAGAALLPSPAIAAVLPSLAPRLLPGYIESFSKRDRLVRYRIIDDLDSVPALARRLDQLVNWSAKPTTAQATRAMLKYGDWFYYHFADEHYSIHPYLVKAAVVDEDRHEVIGWVVDHSLPFTPSSEVFNLASTKAHIVPAHDIVHLSRTNEALPERWPFGVSVFEGI